MATGSFTPGQPGSAAFWGAGGYEDYLNQVKLAELDDQGERRPRPYPTTIGAGIASIGENIGGELRARALRDRLAKAQMEYAARRNAILSGAPDDSNIPSQNPAPGTRTPRPVADEGSPVPPATPGGAPPVTTGGGGDDQGVINVPETDASDNTRDLTFGGDYTEPPMRPATEEELTARTSEGEPPQQGGNIPGEALDPTQMSPTGRGFLPPAAARRAALIRALMAARNPVPYANTAPGVPQGNPTQAAGDMVSPQPGPLAASGSQGGPVANGPGMPPGQTRPPIRLASLAPGLPGEGLPGGNATMSDAPPPSLVGATAQNAPVPPGPNPAIVSDINPAPSSMFTPLLFSPQSMGGGAAGFRRPLAPSGPVPVQSRPVQTERILGGALPNPAAIQPAPQSAAQAGTPLNPSQRPLPQPQAQVMLNPGPEPPSGIVPPSAAMQYWAKIMNNPSFDPTTQKQAAEKYAQGEHFRALQQQQMEKTHDEWMKKADAWDEFQMKAYDRGIEQTKNLMGLEQTRGTIGKTGLESQKLQQEIDVGTAPKIEVDPRTNRMLMWNQKTGRMEDVAQGVNPLDLNITGEEGKKVEFYVRARNASDKLNSDAASLTNLGSALATRKLGLLGNYAVNPQFQRDYNLAKTWGMAVLRDESGAALPVKEIESKMDTYWPVPGDKPETIAAKAQLRRNEETSFYLSLGKSRPVADYYLERRTDLPEGAKKRDENGKVKQIVKNGLWMDVSDGR